MTLKNCVFIPLFALFLLAAAPTSAQEAPIADPGSRPGESIDWKKGEWGHLSPFIGTYEYDAVLGDERVIEVLTRRLGATAAMELQTLMEARRPIAFDDGCLLLSGNAHSQADQQSAFVAVCLYKGEIHAALKQDGAITLYTAAERYEFLPPGLKEWVYFQRNPGVIDQIPPGVRLMLAP